MRSNVFVEIGLMCLHKLADCVIVDYAIVEGQQKEDDHEYGEDYQTGRINSQITHIRRQTTISGLGISKAAIWTHVECAI